MANALDAYNPIFYAQEGLKVLENTLGMARRVHTGYDRERKSFGLGDTIQIRQPGTFAVTTGGTSYAVSGKDVTPKYIQMSVDQWKQVKFGLTDKELAYTSTQIIADHIQPAVYSLANQVEGDLSGLYSSVPWSYNTNSTIAVEDITGPRKILRDNAGTILDTDNMHYAIDSQLEMDFLNLGIFHQAQVAGDSNKSALLNAQLGQRFGVNFFVQQTLSSHTSGTVVSATTDVTGALATTTVLAASTISVSGLTGVETLAVGDSLLIAGSTQKYVVTATTTLTGGANSAIPVYPKLVMAYPSAAEVKFEDITATPEIGGTTNYADAYNYNLMFHRNAFAFATAPLPEIGDGAGARMATITDPRTGLSLRSRVAYDDDAATIVITLDILYGIKCLDPNLAVVVRRNV